MTAEGAEGGRIIPYMGIAPTIAPGVFIGTGAVILGDVTIGADSSIWFNVVIRGDVHWIRIGERTNVQDLAMLHCTYRKNPLSIGNDVTIGHHAMLHGCTIEDAVLVGMNATVLDRAVVEHHSMIAAGSVVREGFRVPSGTLAAGVPARIVRDITDDERAFLEQSARNYMFYVSTFRQSESTP
jgi:gamma-carbonic anhydrase